MTTVDARGAGRTAPGSVSIETPEHVGFSVELADLGSRFLAILVDTAIQGALVLAVAALGGLILLGLSRSQIPDSARTSALSVLAGAGLLAGFLIIWGYHIGFETWMRGQTPGKRAFGLRVVKDSGAPVGFFDAVIRNLMRTIDLLPTSYAAGVVSILVTRSHKRLGDLAAGTLVVREPRARPVFGGAHEFDPTRRRLLGDFLERTGELDPGARDRIALTLADALGVEDGSGDAARALAALSRLRAPARDAG